ncbi:hypothetical protein TRFO_43138 [Tritrichomonas foetus]|uniref:ribonuclease H n=1 Tax=Tritrichomonas foetus TaxID=1144522 RepID=A0A1J4KXF4_9EUKA|nr:hypothetical protein TRFO_43138 [Tritrichomonas foetus]|eukprot:OHT14237.1 hypothetical protein TRFO_43138 [Tritrichomonas foetus]
MNHSPIDPISFKSKLRFESPFHAYTDGACRGNPGPGGWGAIIIQGHLRTEISGYCADTTNNRMEMMAAIEVLSLLPPKTQITISTDSQYLKQGIQAWILNWKRNGWKLKSGGPVKNSELWQRLDKLSSERFVEWQWVKGHHGIPLNERADELATTAIRNKKGCQYHDSESITSLPTEKSKAVQKERDVKPPREAPPPKNCQTVNKETFLEHHRPNERTYIFTDGACSGNPGPGGWGAVIQQGEYEFLLSGGEFKTSNNRMEMKAMIEACLSLPKMSVITLTTDSMYLKDGVTKWMANWKKNGWQTSQGTPVKNQDLWNQIDDIKSSYQISWEWVKGHNNHHQNERCDALAVAAIPQ